MSSFHIFDIAGSALSAQSLRLNTVASNLANADSVGTTENDVYKARMPVFQVQQMGTDLDKAGVRVAGIVESGAPVARRYEPGHPQADDEGYIFASNVNVVEEMVNMISSARTYQSSVEVMNTSKELLLRTINLGRG